MSDVQREALHDYRRFRDVAEEALRLVQGKVNKDAATIHLHLGQVAASMMQASAVLYTGGDNPQ